jgi:hypothetical protein
LLALKQKYGDRFESFGLEIDPAEINFGRSKGLRIIEKFIDPENIDDEIVEIIHKADILSMLNVLEHIEKPDEMISLYKQHMKKGAYLVIEVPRHPSLASFINLVSPDLTYRHLTPPVHLQVFSDKSIEMITGKEFEIVGTWGFGQGYTDLLTNAMLLENITEMELYQSLMDISNYIQKAIDEKGFSDQMIYILKKM